MNDTTPIRRLSLLAIGLCLAFLVTASATFAAASQCRVADASLLPAYAIQGTWTPDQSMLVLVDPVSEQIDVYDGKSGRYRGILQAPSVIGKDAFFPISARVFADRLVVQTRPQRLLFLGDRFQLTDVREPLTELRATGPAGNGAARTKNALAGTAGSVESMFMWSFVGEDIVACGDIQQADGTWVTGIVRFDADRPNGFQSYAESDFNNPEWVFCRMGLPYIASIGETAYVLLMNDEPGIYRIGARGAEREAERLPYELAFGRRARLPEFTNETEFVGTMDAAEKMSMPTGLFASNGRLFVLYRQVGAGDAGLRWILDEVDPGNGRRVGRAVVRSSSPNLMLVPGEKTWALVEKGSVIQFGKQPTERIRLLAANAIPAPLKGPLCGVR